MMKLPMDRDVGDNDNSFINIVVTGKLEMAVTVPPLVPEGGIVCLAKRPMP